MASPLSPPDAYRVAISAAQKEALTEGATWAAQAGIRLDYLAALKEIDFRLRLEPHEWGEGQEWLPELGIRMRCGTSRMITVLFGVDEVKRVVYVKQFRINRRYRA